MKINEKMAKAVNEKLHGFRRQKGNLFYPGSPHINRGICFERSPSDSTGCYINIYFFLPSCPTEHITLSHGYRIRDQKNIEFWWDNEQSISELVDYLKTDGHRFFLQVGDLKGVRKYLEVDTGPSDATMRHHESYIYCLLLLGEHRLARDEIERFLRNLSPEFDWQVELSRQMESIGKLLESGKHHEITSLLTANEAATRKAIGYPD